MFWTPTPINEPLGGEARGLTESFAARRAAAVAALEQQVQDYVRRRVLRYARRGQSSCVVRFHRLRLARLTPEHDLLDAEGLDDDETEKLCQRLREWAEAEQLCFAEDECNPFKVTLSWQEE